MIQGSVLSMCRSADEVLEVLGRLRQRDGMSRSTLPTAVTQDTQRQVSPFSNQELPMPSSIQWDTTVQQQLASRGVDKNTGVSVQPHAKAPGDFHTPQA